MRYLRISILANEIRHGSRKFAGAQRISPCGLERTPRPAEPPRRRAMEALSAECAPLVGRATLRLRLRAFTPGESGLMLRDLPPGERAKTSAPPQPYGGLPAAAERKAQAELDHGALAQALLLSILGDLEGIVGSSHPPSADRGVDAYSRWSSGTGCAAGSASPLRN